MEFSAEVHEENTNGTHAEAAPKKPERYALFAASIIKDPSKKEIIDAIVHLRVERRKTSSHIAEIMCGRLGLHEDASVRTHQKVVQYVCRSVIPSDIQKNVLRHLHSVVMTRSNALVQEGRKTWMEENNHFVWSDEETDFFLGLLRQKEYERPPTKKTLRKIQGENGRRERAIHYNHEALAKTMNERFNREFTSAHTGRKLERIKAEEKRLGRKIVFPEKAPEDPEKTKLVRLSISPDFPLLHEIQWTYIDAGNAITPEETKRIKKLFGEHLEHAHTRAIVGCLKPRVMCSFSPAAQQFLYIILAACYLYENKQPEAIKKLEQGVRNNSDPEHVVFINKILSEIQQQEKSFKGRFARSYVSRASRR